MILDGKKIRDDLIHKLGDTLTGKRVTFISPGDDMVTESFLMAKRKVADKLGIETETLSYSSFASTEDVLEIVGSASIGSDGIVVQLPLAQGVDTDKVLDSIPTTLDIDMLGERSRRAFHKGETERVPPVARAVKILLDEGGVDLKNKDVLILGKGRLVGSPIMGYFDSMNISYKSRDAKDDARETLELLKVADVVISGIGIPGFIKRDMVKGGVVIIDAGTSESGGKVVGDADASCKEVASVLTPVPGGVGPVAVVALFMNLKF